MFFRCILCCHPTHSFFSQAVTLACHNLLLSESLNVVPHITIFVSPSFYHQRSRFYSGFQNCKVVPLLFKWSHLNAERIKSLMRVEADDTMPLYMSSILDMLRKMQKSDTFPTFTEFISKLKDLDFSQQQISPLQLRLNLLNSFIAESKENAHLPWTDINDCGSMVVIDLTDPMLAPQEANAIFQVFFFFVVLCCLMLFVLFVDL